MSWSGLGADVSWVGGGVDRWADSTEERSRGQELY